MSLLPVPTPWFDPNFESQFVKISVPVRITGIVLLSVAIYNSVELVVLILLSFKKYKGLYFWSLLLASSAGVMLHSIMMLLFFYVPVDLTAIFTLSSIAWWFMVSGQSLVLYSRLHLVLLPQLVMRLILAMIIFDAITLHITDTVIGIGLLARGERQGAFQRGYPIFEKIQVTAFTVQEVILSSVYLRQAGELLPFPKNRTRRFWLYQVIAMNVSFLLMDSMLLAFAYLNLWIIHATTKPLVYSLKLKMELLILRRLVHLSKKSSGQEVPDFVDPSQLAQNDFTHAYPSEEISRRPSIDFSQRPSIEFSPRPSIELSRWPSIELSPGPSVELSRRPSISPDPASSSSIQPPSPVATRDADRRE
ncbi:hypothetical protein FQN57_002635 [Myotisia sp. PD_48]|nr:hypothetical protein FQN57_002635 [Myotisia sp. PD_48]